METEKVTAGRRITVGEVTLVPIVRTAASCRQGQHGLVGFGASLVIAVVVLSGEPPRAIDITGEDVPVADYANHVPELAGSPRDG